MFPSVDGGKPAGNASADAASFSYAFKTLKTEMDWALFFNRFLEGNSEPVIAKVWLKSISFQHVLKLRHAN